MLDERQVKAIESKVIGGNISDMARKSGVTRNTIYKWIELEEFKAEVSRCQQEFISSTIQIITAYAPKNAQALIDLADSTTNKKIELDARLALLNKTMPNTTKISIDDGRDAKDNVPVDVLDQELQEFDEE
jgi:transposase-like protein